MEKMLRDVGSGITELNNLILMQQNLKTRLIAAVVTIEEAVANVSVEATEEWKRCLETWVLVLPS